MRARGVTAAFLLVVLTVVGVVACGAAERPAERVSPAPQVNPDAVVWRTPEPPTDPQAGDVWISPKDGAQMVYVPAGEFLMGTTDADIAALVKEDPLLMAEMFADEQPQFRARLPGYWIDKCEVTVARYRKFCRETGRKMPDAPKWGGQDDHPIVKVNWDDAAAYAEWAGKRLPTEMEWEKAARGTDGRQYPWGNAWDASKCANWENSKSGGTHPVGSYPSGASPYGALDMAGNVWEWCAGGYEYGAYKRYARGDLTPPGSSNFRVLRGCSWLGGAPTVFRCASRFNALPGTRDGNYGFRCARGPG